MLSEIHHRVKNNLQVVSSLLSLQERAISDIDAKTAIHEGKERIHSMELVHKLLYQKGRYAGIDIQEYVKRLLDGLFKSFGKETNQNNIKIDVPSLILDVDTAVPLGLILNELAVNSLKYFRSVSEDILIKISLVEKNNALMLEFSDNGSGKAEQLENANSFGMKIVKALLRQLNGIMQIQDESGLRFIISFKNYKLINNGN